MPRALVALAALAVLPALLPARPAPDAAAPPRLLLAFASTRVRRDPPYPQVYFYEHDGVAGGKLLPPVESITKGTNFTRADMHPALSRDGRLCAFSAQFGILDGARVEVWDRTDNKLVPLPGVQETPKVHQMGVALSGDGKRVAYSAWARPGGSARWGVYVYDVPTGKVLDLPGLNRDAADQRMPALSADGRVLAYASNARGGVGATDVYLYDLVAKAVVAVPELNGPTLDLQPALSGDGRLVAVSSDRPGGVGGRDIYLFDRTDKKFLPLPGLNSADADQSPALSPDGRYVAFVSERAGGAGDRDIYLYDRTAGKLLPTPGLNHQEDDFDPCLVTPGATK